jgi:Tol biopolymer transport system component
VRLSTALLGALIAAALVAPLASAAKDDTLLVSRAPGAKGSGGDGTSYGPSVSGDGRLVAFTSEAENLLAADKSFFPDAYVRNLVTDELTLADRANGVNGAVANETAFANDISANGRYVVFSTIASNLDPAVNEPDGDASQVYVRDLTTHKTTLVSRASGATGAPGDDIGSDRASISDDGRYVAFVSFSSNLSSDDSDLSQEIYVRDLVSKTTTLVTRSIPGVKEGYDSYNGSPEISGDGRFVAFTSSRDDLYTDGTDRNNVLVADLVTGTIDLVSRASGVAGAPGDRASDDASISRDGRFVAFTSDAGNLAPGADATHPDVFVRDRQTASTTLLTSGSDAGQPADAIWGSVAGAISADGRYVAIDSNEPGLVPAAPPGDEVGQVLVRDTKTGAAALVSRASGSKGALGNDSSGDPAISGDGRIVAFDSVATNLHPDSVAAGQEDDVTTAEDVFARDVLGGTQPPGGSGAKGCPRTGNVIIGTAKRDRRAGTSATDIMYGRAGNDRLRGAGGADCIYGQTGRDRLLGQNGSDRLFGGAAADRLDGGRGSDRLKGEGGNDRLTDRRGRDRFSGGGGNDRIDARDRSRRDRRRPDSVHCGTGRHDVARVDAADHAAADCERILRR